MFFSSLRVHSPYAHCIVIQKCHDRKRQTKYGPNFSVSGELRTKQLALKLINSTNQILTVFVSEIIVSNLQTTAQF